MSDILLLSNLANMGVPQKKTYSFKMGILIYNKGLENKLFIYYLTLLKAQLLLNAKKPS